MWNPLLSAKVPSSLFIFCIPCWLSQVCTPHAALVNSGRHIFAFFWLTRGQAVAQLVDPLGLYRSRSIGLEHSLPSHSLLVERSSASFGLAVVNHSFIPEPQGHVAFAAFCRVFCCSRLISHTTVYLKKIEHSCCIQKGGNITHVARGLFFQSQ